jgi:hypothetical protein
VLLLSKDGIKSLSVPNTGQGWQIFNQYTTLQHLSVWFGTSGVKISGRNPTLLLSDSQWQAVYNLRGLTSLKASTLLDLSPLSQLTHLKHLQLDAPGSGSIAHVEALAQLTALTRLTLGTYIEKACPLDNNMACIVSTLSSLQHLDVPNIPNKAWADALASMTGLTHLTLSEQHHEHRALPITLPGVKTLTIGSLWARQLAQITAPQVQLLEGGDYRSLLTLNCLPAATEDIKKCASGLLRWCSKLQLAPAQHGIPWPAGEAHAALAAMCSAWRPATAVIQKPTGGQEWSLSLMRMPFGQAEAALLPIGLTKLRLRWVMLCMAHALLFPHLISLYGPQCNEQIAGFAGSALLECSV